MSAPSWTYFCLWTWLGPSMWSGEGWEAKVASKVCCTVGPSDSGHSHRPRLGQSQQEEDQRTRQGDRFFLLSLAILARFSGAHGEARGIVLRREVAVSAEIHSHLAGK